MTEETLQEAIEIKQEIDGLRKVEKELILAEDHCQNDNKYSCEFRIAISKGGCTVHTAEISLEAAKKALDNDIKETERKLGYFEKQLSERH